METFSTNLQHIEEELGKNLFKSDKKIVQLEGMLKGLAFTEEELRQSQKSLFPFSSS